MPDWYHDRDLTTEQADRLAGIELMRIEQPVVWALLNGVETSLSIAKRINWPHDWVLIELRELKKQDIVYDEEGRASVIWKFRPDETDFLDYKRWVSAQHLPGGLFNPKPESQE